MPYYNMNDMGVKSEAVSPLAEIQSIVGELMKFGLVTYYKGEGSKPHFHPNDEQFVFILEGQRMSILGDDERVVVGDVGSGDGAGRLVHRVLVDVGDHRLHVTGLGREVVELPACVGDGGARRLQLGLLDTGVGRDDGDLHAGSSRDGVFTSFVPACPPPQTSAGAPPVLAR